MPYNGSGTFILAQAPFVPATPISSSAMNADLGDIANGLSDAVTRDGQGAMDGNPVTPLQVATKQYVDNAVSTGDAPLDALSYNGMQINGSMEVSQENGTTAVALSTGVAAYVIDTWQGKFVRAATLAISCQQVTPPGTPSFQSAFQKALQIKATTGLGSLASGDYGFLEQTIEGYRASRIDFGSSGASSVTIGFWVYATIAGTMTVALLNSAVNRAIPVNVVINNATTWEFKTVTFAGDTSGTWLFTNGVGLRIRFCFGAGSTFQGTNNTWTGSQVFATSTTTNFFAGTNNLACITGLIVIPGSKAPTTAQSPLIMRPYDQELILCKRYYRRIGGEATGDVQLIGYAGAALAQTLPLDPAMRAIPTITQFGSFTNTNVASTLFFAGTNAFGWQIAVTVINSGAQSYGDLGGFICDARL